MFKSEDFIDSSLITGASIPHPSGRRDLIRLDLNEANGFIDEQFLAKLRAFDAFTVSAYPEYERLYELLAKYVGVPQENLKITNGSTEAIRDLVFLLFRDGDRVVMPAPSFLVYGWAMNLRGVKMELVSYKVERDIFVFPFEETMAALVPGVRGLCLTNPGNPIGVALSEHELTALLDRALELGIPVLLDEAYFEYYGASAVTRLPHYKNLVILRTFSKAFGLAGVRLGYSIAHPDVISALDRTIPVWNTSGLAVHAGICALEESESFLTKIKKALATREEIAEYVKAHALLLQPTETNFLIFKTHDARRFVSTMRECGVLISDISRYPDSHGLLDGYVRTSLPQENDRAAVKEAFLSAFEADKQGLA